MGNVTDLGTLRSGITVQASGADAEWQRILTEAKRLDFLSLLNHAAGEYLGHLGLTVVTSNGGRVEIDRDELSFSLETIAGIEGAPVDAIKVVAEFAERLPLGVEPSREWWTDVTVTGTGEDKSWQMALSEAKSHGVTRHFLAWAIRFLASPPTWAVRPTAYMYPNAALVAMALVRGARLIGTDYVDDTLHWQFDGPPELATWLKELKEGTGPSLDLAELAKRFDEVMAWTEGQEHG